MNLKNNLSQNAIGGGGGGNPETIEQAARSAKGDYLLDTIYADYCVLILSPPVNLRIMKSPHEISQSMFFS